MVTNVVMGVVENTDTNEIFGDNRQFGYFKV